MKQLNLIFVFLFGILILHPVAFSKNLEIGDITIDVPDDCVLNEELSEPDNGAYCYKTPSNDFMLIFMYFEFDGSFSAVDRLIGEADQMGIELSGDGDIATMNLGDGKMLEFTMTPYVGIGVSFFYPEDNIGIYICAISPEEDNERIWKTMSSVRAK